MGGMVSFSGPKAKKTSNPRTLIGFPFNRLKANRLGLYEIEELSHQIRLRGPRQRTGPLDLVRRSSAQGLVDPSGDGQPASPRRDLRRLARLRADALERPDGADIGHGGTPKIPSDPANF